MDKKRILLVEDEGAVSMLIEDMILDLGHDIVGPAFRFDGAMALARDAGIDAAVLDIALGDRVVYPVADVLCSRGIPFVFSTGYANKVIPGRFEDVPVLCKPFSTIEFAEALGGLLEGGGTSRSASLRWAATLAAQA